VLSIGQGVRLWFWDIGYTHKVDMYNFHPFNSFIWILIIVIYSCKTCFQQSYILCGWEVMGIWLRAKTLGCRFKPYPQPCREFFNPRLQKNQQGTPSQGNSNLQWLWRDSYEGVDRTSKLPESLLHRIIIIIFYLSSRFST